MFNYLRIDKPKLVRLRLRHAFAPWAYLTRLRRISIRPLQLRLVAEALGVWRRAFLVRQVDTRSLQLHFVQQAFSTWRKMHALTAAERGVVKQLKQATLQRMWGAWRGRIEKDKRVTRTLENRRRRQVSSGCCFAGNHRAREGSRDSCNQSRQLILNAILHRILCTSIISPGVCGLALARASERPSPQKP